MLRWLAIVALIGCGRIDFDPVIGVQPDGGGIEDGSSGDGAIGDGGGDAAPDAAVTACASAIPIGVGDTITIDTCQPDRDLLDGCGPAGTREVVFAFTVPASGGYNFRAFNAGTNTISNSTGLVNVACDGTETCAGILSRSYTAGDVVYFAVEAASGGCVTIDFENF